ncbi:MAG: hypothetical protein WD077_00395 [Bacteroidia bacterium]
MIKANRCQRGIRRLILIPLLIFLTSLSAQPVPDEMRDSIIKEGRNISTTRFAANSAIAAFGSKQKFSGLDGYITYKKGSIWINVFYAKSGDSILVQHTLNTNDLKNPGAWSFSDVKRKPSELEGELMKVREAVLEDLSLDTDFYDFYDDLGFEPVILPKKDKYYVYLMPTSPEKEYVLFGNDYLLVLDASGNIQRREKLHSEIHSLPAKPEGQGTTMGSMHEHHDDESVLPTPTDIAVLLYNKDRVDWDQHIILSKKFMSIFYLDQEGMAIFPAGSYDK